MLDGFTRCWCLGATLAASALATASDWPRFLGPDANGISTEKGIRQNWNVKPPKMVWSVPMSDNGYSGPSVANGLVMIVDHIGDQDVVRALRLSNGQEVWRFQYPEKVDRQHGFARATPTVQGGKVYTISRMGVAHCLDAKTGKLVWRVDTIKEFAGKVPQWFVSGSPLIDGNRVIFTPGGQDATVVALDKNTGKTIWAGGGTGEVGYATPVIATLNGKRQYVVWVMERLLGLDPSTGATLWTFSFPKSCSIATPVQVGQSIFITSGYNKGCALVDVAGSDATARWQNREVQAHISTPVLVGGYLYGNSDPGLLVCLDPQTGVAQWKQRGFEKGPVMVVDGVLLAMEGSTGVLRMVEISPKAYRELGSFTPLGGKSWTAPIVAQGKLIVRNEKTLACFDLKG